MKRTFEFNDDKSGKFWSIETSGNQFTVTFGKIGTTGQSQTKTFVDEAACTKEANKLIVEKTKKGYVEQDGEKPVATAQEQDKAGTEQVEKTVVQGPVTAEKTQVVEKNIRPPSKQAQAVIDVIIAEIERQEAAIRAALDEEIDYIKGNWLRPGWVNGIFFHGNASAPIRRTTVRAGTKPPAFMSGAASASAMSWRRITLPRLISVSSPPPS